MADAVGLVVAHTPDARDQPPVSPEATSWSEGSGRLCRAPSGRLFLGVDESSAAGLRVLPDCFRSFDG